MRAHVQVKEAVLKGKHPVTFGEATLLAGMQCQIELGNFSELQHKPGNLECALASLCSLLSSLCSLLFAS